MLDRINIGEFDRRITIQFKPVPTRDGTYNQPVQGSWTTNQVTVWAKKVHSPRFDGEEFEADQVRTRRRATYMIRHSSDVSGVHEEDRIIEGTEVYEIDNITGGKREGYLMIRTIYKDEAEVT